MNEDDKTFAIAGGFVGYLIKLEDLRDYILEGLYNIPPCTIPPIDTLTDAAFEYSILANILLVRIFLSSSSNSISVENILECLAGRQFRKRKLVGNLKILLRQTRKFLQFSSSRDIYIIINLAGNHICFGAFQS